MSRLSELLEELCPDGVEYKKLKEIFNTKNGYTPSKSNESYWENGTIPWFRMEDIRENGHILSDSIQHVNLNAIKGELFPANSIIVATSATVGEHALISVPSLANQRFTYLMLKHEYANAFDIKFLFYYCYKLDLWCLSHLNQGSFPSVDMKQFSQFEIPVPPLAIQNEIVKLLDNFTELTAELTAELQLRKKQYSFYRDSLLNFASDGDKITIYKRLSELAEIGTGSSNTNEGVSEGTYPFFVRSQEIRWKDSYEYDETAVITSGDGVGVGKIFHYIEGKYALHQRAYRIHVDDERLLPKFLFYYMKSTFYRYITKNAVQSSVTSIRRPMLDKYPIPIPPLETQAKIVSILDRFDALCHDLTQGLPAEIAARKKQYEYYRDKLLTFPRKGA